MEGQQAGIVEDLFLLCICICPARCALYSLLLYGGVAVEEFIVQPQQERPSALLAQVLLHLFTQFYTCTHMETKYTNTQIYFKMKQRKCSVSKAQIHPQRKYTASRAQI